MVSWKMDIVPRWPSSDVGVPHSVSWVPATMVDTIPSREFCVPLSPQLCPTEVAGKDWERLSAECEAKVRSGVWDGEVETVVVVRWPADPIQQDVKDCQMRNREDYG